MMTGPELQGALREIPFLDQPDLIAAGVLDDGDATGWRKFALDPHRAACALDPDRADRLAALLCERVQQKEAA